MMKNKSFADDGLEASILADTDDHIQTEATRVVSAPSRSNSESKLSIQPSPFSQLRGFTIRCIFICGITSILLGYDIGIWGAAKIGVREHFNLNDVEVEILIGSLNIVAALGGLASGKLSDMFGRRKTTMIACYLFIVGSFFKCAAMSYASIMVGRVLTGLAVGSGLAIAPLYCAELSPASLRGFLVSLTEIAINMGILLGYAMGWAFADMSVEYNWRFMLGIGGVPPFIILIGLYFMPESPRWLVGKSRNEEAALVLSKVYTGKEASCALAELQDLAKQEKGTWKTFFCPTKSIRPLLVAGVGTAFFQQATGVEAQVYYTPEILESAGFEDVLAGQFIVGSVKLVFIFAAAFVIDKPYWWAGRRPLLLVSAMGMCLAQALLGVNFAMGSTAGLAITSQCLFMAFFSIGYGPICWILASEIFPLNVRGQAMGFATFTNRITSGLIALTFYSMTEAFTPSGASFFFSAWGFLAFVFTLFFVPETKNKSLEDIEKEVAPNEYESTT
eukprot:m.186701 g.186701  ORF g.186701 m.186701 type:complete len:504 (-) comp15594_c0_seq4:1589-3100(-)